MFARALDVEQHLVLPSDFKVERSRWLELACGLYADHLRGFTLVGIALFAVFASAGVIGVRTRLQRYSDVCIYIIYIYVSISV
jgi:hypothetical protein